MNTKFKQLDKTQMNKIAGGCTVQKSAVGYRYAKARSSERSWAHR